MLRPPVDSGCLARTASEIAPGIIMITKRAANPPVHEESEPQYDGHHNHHRDDNRQQCSTWVGFPGPRGAGCGFAVELAAAFVAVVPSAVPVVGLAAALVAGSVLDGIMVGTPVPLPPRSSRGQ